MKRIACALTLMTLNLAAGAAPGEETLQPFTHVAQIPAGSDTGSIRFQKAKMVQTPTTIAFTTSSEYCKNVASRGSDSSMYCPSVRTETAAAAYELTFSFVGRPTTTDGNRNFTFEVYFRPDELAPDVRQAISNGKRSHSDVAGYFKVITDREAVQKIVIDEAKSHFCAGNLLDGSWNTSDPTCKEQVLYKAISVPSDYITVRIDPSPVPAGPVSANQAATAISRNK
jgi:hypothetical protein